MSRQSTIVAFNLTCSESRAWLVLHSGNGKPRVLEMRQQSASIWSVCPDLMPGEYRCRYYCGDDRRITYYGPAKTKGSIDAGLDALVSVKIPKEKRNRQFVQ